MPGIMAEEGGNQVMARRGKSDMTIRKREVE